MEPLSRPAKNGNRLRLRSLIKNADSTTVTAVDHAFLCVVCSGLIVLVTALALATPGIKSTQPRGDDAVLVHLLAHPPCHSAKERC